MLRAKKRLSFEEKRALKVMDQLEDMLLDGVLSEDEFEEYCDRLEYALKDRSGKILVFRDRFLTSKSPSN